MTIEGGALSRARSCCGHASGVHVFRYADPAKGTGASYCNTCGVVCGEKATMVTRGAAFGSPWGTLGQFVKLSKDGARKPEPKRAAFAGLIADLERATADRSSEGPLARSTQPSQLLGLVAGGAFDRMIDDLRREPARAASGPRTPVSPEPDPSEVVLMFEEDEHGRLRAVRHHVSPTRLERLTAELVEASKPPPPSAEEMRVERRRRAVERELREYRRLGQLYRAMQAQQRERRRQFDAVAADLEAAAR